MTKRSGTFTLGILPCLPSTCAVPPARSSPEHFLGGPTARRPHFRWRRRLRFAATRRSFSPARRLRRSRASASTRWPRRTVACLASPRDHRHDDRFHQRGFALRVISDQRPVISDWNLRQSNSAASNLCHPVRARPARPACPFCTVPGLAATAEGAMRLDRRAALRPTTVGRRRRWHGRQESERLGGSAHATPLGLPFRRLGLGFYRPRPVGASKGWMVLPSGPIHEYLNIHGYHCTLQFRFTAMGATSNSDSWLCTKETIQINSQYS